MHCFEKSYVISNIMCCSIRINQVCRRSYLLRKQHQMAKFLICWFLIMNFKSVQSQYIYQSSSIISSKGNMYSPVVPSAQLISSAMVTSYKQCATACNSNTLCRVFDYGALVGQQCRLFEGDIGTLGTIVSSSIPDSQVGSVTITPSLFTQYGQSCSSAVCSNSRYLTCINSTCQCMPHTYWNSTAGICLPQSPILGVSCQQGMNMCRQDLNYTCLQFNQCGRKFIYFIRIFIHSFLFSFFKHYQY